MEKVYVLDVRVPKQDNKRIEVLNEIHHEAKLELTLVEQAISRVESNEYGICSLCTEAINPERLKVLPYIDTCINCAKEEQKQ